MEKVKCLCRKGAIWPSCPQHGIGKGRYLLNLAAFVLVFALAVFAIFTAPADSAMQARPKWMSPLAWALGICETGKGNAYPDFQHDGGSYEGMAGWFTGTWLLDRRPGYPAHAYEATPRQQNRVLHDSLEKGRYFGCLHNGGYRSWM